MVDGLDEGELFVEDAAQLSLGDLRFPLIVKPNFEGSSKGIGEGCVVEDVASLLTSGDVPNVFDEKQTEKINEKYRDVCLAEGLPSTKVGMYARFIREVRQNLHVVIAFSPIGFKPSRCLPSLISSRVTRYGPSGPNVGQPLPLVHWPPRSVWNSRSETSWQTVKPATWLSAFASSM